jgi:hypothetical protein
MQTSASRARLEDALLSFAWDEWAQLGVLAQPTRVSPWAQDPEALLVSTFEIARADPRLFDEVLDWLVTNEHLISMRRLRTLSRRPEDRALTNAVLAWLARHRPNARFSNPDEQEPSGELTPFHGAAGFPVRHPDEAFAQHGWLRAETTASGKSRPPDLRDPIAFGLRLRQLLGVGARAEVVRVLLTVDAPQSTPAAIAASAGYAKRNVQEALSALEQSGVVHVAGGRQGHRYGIDRERWGTLLEVDGGFPAHVAWVQLLAALRRTLRWLRWTDEHELSDYLLASSARDLLEDVRDDFADAGIAIPPARTATDALRDVDDVVRQSMRWIDPG